MRVVPVADGFVAVAGANWFEPPPDDLYTSLDGHTWTDNAGPFGDRQVVTISSDGQRAVVIEDADNPGTNDPGAIWISSTDGTAWARYQLPTRQGDYADSVAILGNRVVVTGSSYNGGNSDGAGVIWVAQIP